MKAEPFLTPSSLISVLFYESPSRILEGRLRCWNRAWRRIGCWRWLLLAALPSLPTIPDIWGSFLWSHHPLWSLKSSFFHGTSGMLVGPPHRSFESTLPSSFGTLLMIRLVPGRKVWGHPDFLFAACLVKHYYNSHSIWPSVLPC